MSLLNNRLRDNDNKPCDRLSKNSMMTLGTYIHSLSRDRVQKGAPKNRNNWRMSKGNSLTI